MSTRNSESPLGGGTGCATGQTSRGHHSLTIGRPTASGGIRPRRTTLTSHIRRAVAALAAIRRSRPRGAVRLSSMIESDNESVALEASLAPWPWYSNGGLAGIRNDQFRYTGTRLRPCCRASADAGAHRPGSSETPPAAAEACAPRPAAPHGALWHLNEGSIPQREPLTVGPCHWRDSSTGAPRELLERGAPTSYYRPITPPLLHSKPFR